MAARVLQPITPQLIRQLPRSNVDIRDSLLTGFLVRCRATGTASYVVSVARGRWITIGRVDRMTLPEARVAAGALLNAIHRDVLQLRAEDITLTLAEAQARARDRVLNERSRRSRTLEAFLDVDDRDSYGSWLMANRKRGAESLQGLKSQFEQFLPLRLTEISAIAVQTWKTGRLKERTSRGLLSPQTVNRNLANLRGALSRALEWGLIRVHPMANLKDAPIERIGRIRFLETDEERRLLAALAARDSTRRQERESGNRWRRDRRYKLRPCHGLYTDHLTPLIILALHTGCRQGELFQATWGDVDIVRAQLTIRAETAKNARSRIVPLNQVAVATLKEWRPRPLMEPGALLFPGRDGARLVDVKTAWAPLLRAAEIDRFRFHDLRHTFASKLVQAGVDLNRVRELLGHRDFSTTLRYAHLAPNNLADAVAKLVATA